MMSPEVKHTPDGCDAAVSILGIPFDRVTVAQAIERIAEMVSARTPHYVVTANVDFLVQARTDIELRRILFEAHLVLCDGTPLVWASRFLRNALPERVAGSDLAPVILRLAATRGFRVFLLGAAPEAAAKAVDRIRQDYPELEVDHYSPTFNRLLEMDHDEIKRRVLAARPDILLVSFGCPKQEKWIAMHYRELGVPVSIGVGATIDFLAGQVRRAPVWMQKAGAEWVFRLLQEPRRLAARYGRDMWVFGTSFFSQLTVVNSTPRLRWRGMREARNRPNVSRAWEGHPSATPCNLLQLPERFDRTAVRTCPLLDEIRRAADDYILDGSKVSHVDSTGLAFLIRLHARLRSNAKSLVLLSPSRALERAVRFAGFDVFLTEARDLNQARLMLSQSRTLASDPVTSIVTADRLKVYWRGEITAANATRYWNATLSIVEAYWEQNHKDFVTLDLSEVPFVDSTGLGLLIRVQKLAGKAQVEVAFTGFQPAVLNVIRLAQLESLFNPEHGKVNRSPALRCSLATVRTADVNQSGCN